MKLLPGDTYFLRLLAYSPFERRKHNQGWRWGTRRIRDNVVDRLIASGRAVQSGDNIRLAIAESAS